MGDYGRSAGDGYNVPLKSHGGSTDGSLAVLDDDEAAVPKGGPQVRFRPQVFPASSQGRLWSSVGSSVYRLSHEHFLSRSLDSVICTTRPEQCLAL